MKQFRQFITEARITKASSEAKRLGLVGDGHGDWYDKQGNLKAKTVAGELKMFSGKGAADEVGLMVWDLVLYKEVEAPSQKML